MTSKFYKFEEKGTGFGSQTKRQDFYKLRVDCISNNTLFEDPEFVISQYPDVEWKRPNAICKNPQLFVEGCTRFDVQQGKLEDCWLLAAVANITLHKHLLSRIVPDDQGFDEAYAGIFHFRFWQYGNWIDVVVDDRLPTLDGKLIFLQSTDKNEFWTPLLEKAYAKLHGSYDALKMGFSSEAMVDLTGGISIMHNTDFKPLLKIVNKAHEMGSLMSCRLKTPRIPIDLHGLSPNHAYSITKVAKVKQVDLLRLWNGGIDSEWTGPWSDKSTKWNSIADEKERLGITFDRDGEFWISFDDFKRLFERIEFCHLHPALLDTEDVDGVVNKRWDGSQIEGEWIRGVTPRGPSFNFETLVKKVNFATTDTFCRNPQYMISLPNLYIDGGLYRLTISLMTKHSRRHRSNGIKVPRIAFDIYRIDDMSLCVYRPFKGIKPLDSDFFKGSVWKRRKPTKQSPLEQFREVSCLFKLPSGLYCIIPFTKPKADGKFLLRVFSEYFHSMTPVS